MPSAKILLVEDDAALLEGLRDILELAGYDVTTARNGLEGLEALKITTPDLIITDIMMPRMDGYQFYDAVRAHPRWVNTPIVFLTARSEQADIRRGLLLGADDYVTKPFEEERLLLVIANKLKRREQLSAAHDTEIAELKYTILTTLNHEIRTPLTYIANYSELLSEAGPDLRSDEFRDFMLGIRAGSERLGKLVEDFMMLVKLQTGEMQEAFERRRLPLTEVESLLTKLVADYTTRATAQGVTLTTRLARPLPIVLADGEYLTDAVTRLLDNALKFSKKTGGEVTLSAAQVNERLVIQVQDTGRGIRAEDLPRLFDVFHQIDRATQEQQGSGSGLAIARGLINLHQGTLSAESEFGVGSIFTISLPVYHTP